MFPSCVYRSEASLLESCAFERVWTIQVENHRISVCTVVVLVKQPGLYAQN